MSTKKYIHTENHSIIIVPEDWVMDAIWAHIPEEEHMSPRERARALRESAENEPQEDPEDVIEEVIEEEVGATHLGDSEGLESLVAPYDEDYDGAELQETITETQNFENYLALQKGADRNSTAWVGDKEYAFTGSQWKRVSD